MTKSPGRPPLYGDTMRQTAVWLPIEMVTWLQNQSQGQSETIRMLIAERMSKPVDPKTITRDMSLSDITAAIYNEVSGADNRDEYARLTGEIGDWLANGDQENFYGMTLADLVAEWRDYYDVA